MFYIEPWSIWPKEADYYWGRWMGKRAAGASQP